MRFFDDATDLTGKYFPGFKVPIENRVSLLKAPCNTILIYSYTFASKIFEKLQGDIPNIDILFVKDL